MSYVQKCTNEVSHHRSLSYLWEIIRDIHFILYRFTYLRKILFLVGVEFDGIFLRDEMLMNNNKKDANDERSIELY